MKAKFQFTLLILAIAAAHAVAQSWVSKSVVADNALLNRAFSAATRISARPLGANWQTADSIWLPSLNSLMWGVTAAAFIGFVLTAARRSSRNAETSSSRLAQLRRLFVDHQAFVPMLALTFASMIAVSLVIARIVVRQEIRYGYLIWNLLLAWMPLLFALLACEKFRAGESRTWRFAALAGAWLLFFPNAPYIFTDVIHAVYGPHRHFWVDLTLILTCALIGLVLGFVSLYLMQSIVRRMYGQIVSWMFIGGVAGLSGFGIYLGRFLRFNSWDVITKPVKLYNGISNWAANPMANSHTFTFPILFATFLFLAYVMLYTLTHLPKPEMSFTESARHRQPDAA